MSTANVIKSVPPRAFLERLELILPKPEFSQCLDSFNQKQDFSLRVNTLKTTPLELENELRDQGVIIAPVRWQKNAFHFPQNQYYKLTTHPLYKSGHFFIQNLSSQLITSILNPQPGENVLDIAAAPGGKSLQMACMMKNRGKIDAIEIVKSKFFSLKSTVYNHKANIVKPYFKDGGKIWKYCRGRFDKVMVDVPCTQEGSIKLYKPESYRHWSLEKIQEIQAKQRRLLFSGIQCLKPGGTLVYSTCSFSPEENEMIINRILEKFHENIFIDDITLPISNYTQGLTEWQGVTMDKSISKTRRIIPTHLVNACFVCKIKKIKS